jgi:hypothetical protein
MADDKGIQKQDEPIDNSNDKTDDSKYDDWGAIDQFKNKEALIKSYKEIQGAFTRTTQELKELKEANEKLKEQNEISQYRTPQNYQNTNDIDFDDLIVQDPRKAIESVNASTYRQMRIAEVLEELQDENADEFQRRYAFANALSQNPQYSHLANSPVGIKKLFKLGDKLREEETKKSASKTLEAILGGPVDEQKIAKLREVLGTANKQQQQSTQLGNVYMPDTSDTYRPGLDSQTDLKKDYDEKARKAENEGDIDGVIEAAFGKALAE